MTKRENDKLFSSCNYDITVLAELSIPGVTVCAVPAGEAVRSTDGGKETH